MGTTVKNIEKILKSRYSTENFVEFVQEIFDSIRLVAPNKLHEERNLYASHILGYSHIGDYSTFDSKKVSIFAVRLNKQDYVVKSRGVQRNYARKLIEAGNSDAAIIAFYCQDGSSWRLSFVRLDYEMTFENGKFASTAKITPAKRYSFLVGEGEPCHTAISRFHNFIIDKNYSPTVDELEEAFSVERVTKEFFELYKEKYYDLYEYLSSNKDFVSEAARCGFTAEQFAKKLLGQIVFLYFIQKKGWLGVEVWPETLSEDEQRRLSGVDGAEGRVIRSLLPTIYVRDEWGNYVIDRKAFESISDEDEEMVALHISNNNGWNDGDRNFLRNAFTKAENDHRNFYESCLKPLFYRALNHNRGSFGYFSGTHSRIPFLSGGLFEPLASYNWKVNCFNIPNHFFSNKDGVSEYSGDGILDVFDRFNFTISEDEPLEREVAIDPEMLGKVFENLLDVKDKKSKGAFYTPREIVHFMCEESIINYLESCTNLSEESVRQFVDYADIMRDEDNFDNSPEKEWMISKELFCVNRNGEITTNRLKEIDNALKNVKIVDPAAGSGAFPLCMLNTIVRLRQSITSYLMIGLTSYDREVLEYERSTYNLKLHAIRDSIFAVDIEPSAVDIAQLRLWLSLVIDDEINPMAKNEMEGHSAPLPLPNLECNIICGDSLINKHSSLGNKIGVAFRNKNNLPGINAVLSKLLNEEDRFFACDDSEKKASLKRDIQSYKNSVVEYQFNGTSTDFIQEYKNAISGVVRRILIWQLEFAKIYAESEGFDIVIGNPPYVQLQKSISGKEKVGDKYSNQGYETFAKSGDMYCLFYELGIKLLKNGGCLMYITSNKWLKTAYGDQLRSYLLENADPKLLIDFSGVRVFETAGVDVCILQAQKQKDNGAIEVCSVKEEMDSSIRKYLDQNSRVMLFAKGDKWNITPELEDEIHRKILGVGKPISKWNINIKYGIKTCLNKVYVIDEQKKDALCREDPNSIEVLSPVLRGRDIVKWKCDYKNIWLVAIHNGIHKYNVPPVDIDSYPAVKRYLTPFMDQLVKKIDQGVTPYHLKNCTYYEEYSKPKIVFQEIEQEPAFALDLEGKYMCVDTVRIITGDHLEYLTGLLNSDLFFFAVKHFFGGGTLGEKGVRMKHTFFKDFTAYVPTREEEEYVKKLVMDEKNNRDEKINEFFYKKYGIDPDEIEYIRADIYGE